jgi:peptidoglycan hydrolase-like protein with peptidoglycan-binding domain
MLNALLYGVGAINVGTTKMNEFLNAVSQYGSATAGAVINYRKTQGFTASDSVDTTLWIDLFSRSNNDTGRTLAVQIGLVAQGYTITVDGKWNAETANALSDFASKKGLNATLNVKILSALMQPCYDAVLSGSSSPSTPESAPAPTEATPTSVAVKIRSSVYYPGCQRWDNSIKPGCNLSVEGGAIDARNASMPGSTYAVAIPAMNIYSEKKGGCQIPYGSVLKITNPRTGLSTNATVRDGGPYVPGRNMDMTEPVARAIGFPETVADVLVELVSVPAPYDNRATYCFGNSLKNGVNGGFPKNTSTIATGPTLGFPSYARK